ncbi:ABC transporter ATP-binding protein [Loigolactobacillus binensis]|uniref:ABC transporter ATP-binding protein n=1 Tax=Loigolactobacillus binensis TaxID=2559922 RepID=A0ABW3EEC1_9LACO|nr:ABC transporter ATP-binding protein [Loigolactobacillus binensis]
MIRFEKVTKTYANEDALHNLDLSISAGELFVLVGPSGSGKTTLLKMINRLVVPTSGKVTIDDENVADMNLEELRRHTGYVLQAGALFPNMTVEQNAAIQLEALGWPEPKRHARILELLKRVDLAPELFLQRKPSELSGGEAQRVGIVRALASNPNLVLMDEPFSALDPLSKRQLQALVLELHRELKTTFVFVTHDMREAIRLADRLAVIHNGELQQLGKPADILADPANEFVRDFFDDPVARQRFLKQVIDSGFGRSISVDDQYVALKGSDTIFQWAALVQQTATQNIRVGNRLLEPVDLIDYMATLK